MAYGFIKKVSERDNEVKIYVDEKKAFEAWITAMRNTDLTAEEFYEKIEDEMLLKHPRLTDEEYESLQLEWMDLTYQREWRK